ncbi:DUF397 domain-containing protein [Nocardia sp. SYP-A9097]|uniref:DUF397 domain-containing protein n=1 Tax=Nocardia sp. SYP-A9097 TaxID=2663237 RepID=UPI001328056E|nr:DUF397 domain-containing protein [Nocardia sp. SYP-A9097]MRH92915.1 DUF397 domain-containing protein [Nocardia sp. SYP-A9097]
MNIDLSQAKWFKSSKSTNASECVEIAFVGSVNYLVGVRDSKDLGTLSRFNGRY